MASDFYDDAMNDRQFQCPSDPQVDERPPNLAVDDDDGCCCCCFGGDADADAEDGCCDQHYWNPLRHPPQRLRRLDTVMVFSRRFPRAPEDQAKIAAIAKEEKSKDGIC